MCCLCAKIQSLALTCLGLCHNWSLFNADCHASNNALNGLAIDVPIENKIVHCCWMPAIELTVDAVALLILHVV